MHTRNTHGERGTILVPVVFLVLMLGGLSAAALKNGLAEQTALLHRETSSRALEIAEAGLVRAELEILALVDADGDGVGALDGRVADGDYEVTAAQGADLPDRWELRARGASRLSVRRVAVGLRRRKAGYWQEGLFARTNFVLNGTFQSDSYDSRLGTWDQQAVNADGAGRYARINGHIGSNGAIDLKGTSGTVRGNAIPGPGHEATFSGSPSVGDTVARTREIDLPPPPEEEFLAAYAAPDNLNMMIRVDDGDGINGDDAELVSPTNWRLLGYSQADYALRAKSQTRIVLPGGTYFFTDLDLSGLATLEIAGPCKIYVTGSLDLTGGGLVNTSGIPANCQIFAHPYAIPSTYNPTAGTIRLDGGAQVAAAIYAPYRDADIGGTGDIFGALIANKITVVGDAFLHYDESLQNLRDDGKAFVERLYWRELDPPRR